MGGGAAQTCFCSGLTGAAATDLLPVKPLKEDETDIRGIYRLRLRPLWDRIKPRLASDEEREERVHDTW